MGLGEMTTSGGTRRVKTQKKSSGSSEAVEIISFLVKEHVFKLFFDHRKRR